mmetsp:Transcript_38725/g.57751  ORF Transcript_38725/g.57751 Transcript_38725/m.57751 type:complete len:124 (-) Transcript_38725:95-466(-)
MASFERLGWASYARRTDREAESSSSWNPEVDPHLREALGRAEMEAPSETGEGFEHHYGDDAPEDSDPSEEPQGHSTAGGGRGPGLERDERLHVGGPAFYAPEAAEEPWRTQGRRSRRGRASHP